MTSSEKNIEFYARYGFVATDEGYGRQDQVFEYLKDVKHAVFLAARCVSE